ncbi:MAG: putative Ig domain-containing protein, partial [Pseudomonadota bacterium]
PTQDDLAPLEVRVTATDPDGLSANQTFTLTVLAFNNVPVAEDAVIADPVAADTPFVETLGTLEFPIDDLASDADSNLAAGSFSFTGAAIDGVPTPSLEAAGVTYNPGTDALDPDAGLLTLDPDLVPQFVALPDGAQSVLVVDFVVSDGEKSDAGTITFTISGVNDQPTLQTSLADRAVTTGETKVFVLPADTFADADAGDVLTLSATLVDGTPLPADVVAFDPDTETFTVTPGEDDAGTLAIRVTATDTLGAQTFDDFTLTVETPPVVTLNEDITQTQFETFQIVENESRTGVTTVDIGADGNLYSGDIFGNIVRYTLDPATGLATSAETIINVGGPITGLKFDPDSPAEDMDLWIAYATTQERYSSIVSEVSITADSAIEQQVITGLPYGDHQVNGLDFGPDGRLYIQAGGLSSLGEFAQGAFADPEVPLSAALLVADVNNDPRFANGPVNVQADETGAGYDPFAIDAPVQIYATGLRNAYDIEWTLNTAGEQIAVAGVNANSLNKAETPDDPSTPANENLIGIKPSEQFVVIQEGNYYGHPNPIRGEYILNGGNPTGGVDPFEITEYAVGTQPEDGFDPGLILGIDQFGADSPNGVDTYIDGTILQTTFSGDREILLLEVDENNSPIYQGDLLGTDGLPISFSAPLDIVTDPNTGRIYVANFGNGQSDPANGSVFLIVPEEGALSVDPGRPGSPGGNGNPGGTGNRIEAEVFSI